MENNPEIQSLQQSAKFHLPKKYTYILLPVLLIALAAVSLPFFVIPQVNNLIKTQKDIQKLQQKDSSLKAKIAQLENLSETEINTNAALLTLALPTQKAVEESFIGLMTLASQNNLQLLSLKLTPGLISTDSAKVNTSNNAQDLLIDIGLQGETIALENYLNAILRTLPILTVEETLISYPDTLTIKLASSWSPLPTKLPSVETPLPQITAKDQNIIQLLQEYKTLETPAESGGTPSSSVKTDPFTP